jgi:pyruvate formate-lyase activating enzyme-like uncharacterized protein
MPTGIREQYFDIFSKKGVEYPASGNLSKPVIGSLSPGCRTCIAGTWSCLYISCGCTKKCFFCPTPQKQSDGHIKTNVPEKLSFNSAKDYIEYLKVFDFNGIAFSGGEPLLATDTIVEYTKEIKRVFGDKHYFWAYTNGDPATTQNLSRLKKAGLNELRFDIASNDYDLTAVTKAVKFIDTVSVEIPAIPEDIDKLKSIIKELEQIGVKYLNMHQLMKTEYNSERMNQRGYSPVNEDLYPDNTPILESELAALEILKYAIELKSGLGINYCSRCYKSRFQGMANRRRAIVFCGDKEPHPTETGYLRKAAVDASTKQAAFIKQQLNETEFEMTSEGDISQLVFPLERFHLLLTEDYQKADVIYYDPVLALANSDSSIDKSQEMIGGNSISFQANEIFRSTLDNTVSAFLFNSLFIARNDIKSVIKELLDVYELGEEKATEMVHDVKEFYKRFQGVEYLSPDLDPYD